MLWYSRITNKFCIVIKYKGGKVVDSSTCNDIAVLIGQLDNMWQMLVFTRLDIDDENMIYTYVCVVSVLNITFFVWLPLLYVFNFARCWAFFFKQLRFCVYVCMSDFVCIMYEIISKFILA